MTDLRALSDVRELVKEYGDFRAVDDVTFVVKPGTIFGFLGPNIQFVAPEIVAMGVLFTAVFSGIEIIWDRQFGLTGLPRALQALIRINPLTYGVDGLRGSASGTFQFGIGTDFIVLGALTLILVAIGSYLFSRIDV